MRKTVLSILIVSALLLTACGAPLNKPQPEPEETAAAVPTEETAAETTANSEHKEPQKPVADDYVFDECGVLQQNDVKRFHDVLQQISDSRLLCTAVVITDSLGGETPEQFASDYYRKLFGTATSGFLLLINNDTGKDVYHLEGVCDVYMTDTQLRIAQATPYLVEGDYPAALDLLLPAAESVPELVFDRSGSLDSDQTAALLAQAEGTKHAVFLTEDAPEPSADEDAEAALAAYAEEMRGRVGADTLLTADVSNGRLVIAGTAPETLTADLQTVWDEADLFEVLTQYYDSF